MPDNLMDISADDFSKLVDDLSVTVTKPNGDTATLTILNTSNIPPALQGRSLVLCPQYEYQTGYSTERQGCAEAACREINWTANYFYYHCPVGGDRYSQVHNGVIADNVKAISDAILAACLSLGVSDVEVQGSDPNIVPGPDDMPFYGATVAIAVKDYKNL